MTSPLVAQGTLRTAHMVVRRSRMMLDSLASFGSRVDTYLCILCIYIYICVCVLCIHYVEYQRRDIINVMNVINRSFVSPRLASCHLASKDFEIFQLGQKLDASWWDGYPNAKEVTSWWWFKSLTMVTIGEIE